MLAPPPSRSYVPQEAWVTNATLRDNILLTGLAPAPAPPAPIPAAPPPAAGAVSSGGGGGEEGGADWARYRRALHAAALEEDVAALPGGDLTEIGERGVTLSGGQKQRVRPAAPVRPLPGPRPSVRPEAAGPAFLPLLLLPLLHLLPLPSRPSWPSCPSPPPAPAC
jgi:hypothetical protein